MKFLIGILIALGLFLFVFVLPVVGWFTGSYNSAVGLRNQATTEEATIEAQMQRRADLVPNLVTTTKGAMIQEQAVFDDIAKAHAAFSNAPAGTAEKMAASDALSTAIRGYMVVAQQYPKLESLEIMKNLQTTMEGTENRISVARQRYNEAVRDYNNRIQAFPLTLFAGSMGFQKMTAFQADAKGLVNPNVNFLDMKR